MKKILDFKQHYFETTKHVNESESPYFMGDKGKNSELYNAYYDEFVPTRGCSKYVIGELIRIASRMIHEYYNNGNGNAAEYQYEEECYDTEVWDEEAEEYYTDTECEEVEGECEVSNFYGSMLEFVEKHGPKGISDTISQIERIICNTANYDEEDNAVYTSFVDQIVEFVQNNYMNRETVEKADPDYYNYHKAQ